MLKVHAPFQPLLKFADGRDVASPADWPARRREIRAIIEKHCYGTMPKMALRNDSAMLTPLKPTAHYEWDTTANAYYTQYQTRPFADSEYELTFEVYLPVQKSDKPFPALICGDGGWMRATPDYIRLTTSRGYALVVFNRTQAFPDFMLGGGVGTLPPESALERMFPKHKFTAIASWAWGFSRVMDALAHIPAIDFSRVAVCGHSRGGKASLLAGALDTRFAVVFTNNSGMGGAGSLTHEGEGTETIGANTALFPNWFAPKFGTYAGNESTLPFDFHFVKALCAPRPLLCTEAMRDPWANTEGTAASTAEARQVWRFLGAPEQFCGIRFRNGVHGHFLGDWEAMFDFADYALYNKAIPWDPTYTPYG